MPETNSNLSLNYGWGGADLKTQLESQGYSLEDGSWGPPTFAAIKECYMQGMITEGEMRNVVKRFAKNFWEKAKVVELVSNP